MKKTILSLLALMATSVAVKAQYQPDVPPFAQDKIYMSASFSGFDLGYNGTEKLHLNLEAKGGYFFLQNFMALANVGYGYYKEAPDYLKVGAGLRYYIEENGIYMGVSGNYVHANHDYDDFMPQVNLGYAFFLNRTVTIEPEVYYNQSFKNHSDYSGLGFRIGFGIYFE
jgi:hypothetical protein